MGALKYFLGIEIARSKEGIYLSQLRYPLELVIDVGVLGAKPYHTPMEQNKKLTGHDLDAHMH